MRTKAFGLGTKVSHRRYAHLGHGRVCGQRERDGSAKTSYRVCVVWEGQYPPRPTWMRIIELRRA